MKGRRTNTLSERDRIGVQNVGEIHWVLSTSQNLPHLCSLLDISLGTRNVATFGISVIFCTGSNVGNNPVLKGISKQGILGHPPPEMHFIIGHHSTTHSKMLRFVFWVTLYHSVTISHMQ